MNNNTVVISTLVAKRETLLAEQRQANARFDSEIAEVENAIELLSGERVWERTNDPIYSDTHPDYIKSSSVED
jgi:hypothetical protein